MILYIEYLNGEKEWIKPDTISVSRTAVYVDGRMLKNQAIDFAQVYQSNTVRVIISGGNILWMKSIWKLVR